MIGDTINAIKEAEANAAQIGADAKAEAGKIVAGAKEKAEEEQNKVVLQSLNI